MSQSKIYVGNLSYQVSQDDLHEFFGQFGAIQDVKLITDRETGRSKGFAFITFENADSVNPALDLNGTEYGGRKLKVSVAKDNGDRRRSGGARDFG
ncbi:MAG: RNA-binding protein [Legionellales bacterium]|nr:RNA-binding protein [Legionellales bacterium]|tara:strand:+ start:729 stop:1016 length:288 start_codon:yes stop_codon:yes gene_type:complete